jgi:chromosome segregation ATPase
MKRLAAVFASLLFAFGCSTAAPDRAVRTSETLSSLQEQLTVARTRVDTTLGSLRNLTSTSPDSLRAAYDAYARDVQALEKSATSIHNSNDELRNRTADYFANWKKDTAKVSNPELQAIADQRRHEVRDHYDRFRASYAGASSSLDTLLKDLHDLRSVIGNDLTEATQSQVRDTTVVQSAASDGSRAQSAIDAALADSRALSQELAPTAGQ